VADRLAVMNKGEIVQVGPAEDVVRKPSSAFVADFFGVENVFNQKYFENGFLAPRALGRGGVTVKF